MVQAPSDTSHAAARKQVELLRGASPSRRLDLMFSLSADVVAMSREALHRAHPDLDARARSLLFIELHYGRDLAERLKSRLEHPA